jgi:hypothetical protein
MKFLREKIIEIAERQNFVKLSFAEFRKTAS